MWTRRAVRTGAMAVGVLVLALALRGEVFAPPGPQPSVTIDDLLGIWRGARSWTWYDLTTGSNTHFRDRGTCVITKVDPTTVNVEFTLGGVTWNEEMTYTAGVLRNGASDTNVPPSSSATEYLFVRGKPGHLTAKGAQTWYTTVDVILATMSFTQVRSPNNKD